MFNEIKTVKFDLYVDENKFDGENHELTNADVDLDDLMYALKHGYIVVFDVHLTDDNGDYHTLYTLLRVEKYATETDYYFGGFEIYDEFSIGMVEYYFTDILGGTV